MKPLDLPTKWPSLVGGIFVPVVGEEYVHWLQARMLMLRDAVLDSCDR